MHCWSFRSVSLFRRRSVGKWIRHSGVFNCAAGILVQIWIYSRNIRSFPRHSMCKIGVLLLNAAFETIRASLWRKRCNFGEFSMSNWWLCHTIANLPHSSRVCIFLKILAFSQNPSIAAQHFMQTVLKHKSCHEFSSEESTNTVGPTERLVHSNYNFSIFPQSHKPPPLAPHFPSNGENFGVHHGKPWPIQRRQTRSASQI